METVAKTTRADVEAALNSIVAGDSANAREGLRIDFKVDGRSLKDDLSNIAEDAACFANADGGYVICGVRDRPGGIDAFVGTRLDPEKTRMRIYEITQPHLFVTAEVLNHPAGDVLLIEVPRGLAVHSVSGDLPHERIDDNCVPMSTDRIASVVAERRGSDWSAEATDTPASDVDPLAMTTARGLLARSSDEKIRRLAAEPQDIDVLRALGVVHEGTRLTNAGSLLFVGSSDAGAAMS